MDSTRDIFLGMQILIENEWVNDHAILVEHGVIKAILHEEMLAHHLPARKHYFPKDYFLIPGLIDLHIHGSSGYDVMDANQEALCTISESLAAEGVTGFLATTMSAKKDYLHHVLATIAANRSSVKGAAILGVHLEGPFISTKKLGAQAFSEHTIPDIKFFQSLQTSAANAIKLVTLAPELPGVLPIIKNLDEMGIVVSIGHTHATYAEAKEAIHQGCSYATHLFNAMSGLHQREPGAAGAILLADHVSAELIVDGVHLHPAMVELSLRLKGKERLILVTDAMRAKCLGEGKYDLGGQTVFVQGNKAALEDGTLAGSVLRMPEAIKNMVHFTQCSLIDAVKMASLNPAKILKLDHRKGSIEINKDADLAILNSSLDVMLTMQEGKIVYTA